MWLLGLVLPLRIYSLASPLLYVAAVLAASRLYRRVPHVRTLRPHHNRQEERPLTLSRHIQSLLRVLLNLLPWCRFLSLNLPLAEVARHQTVASYLCPIGSRSTVYSSDPIPRSLIYTDHRKCLRQR